MELFVVLIAVGAGILIGIPTGPARFFVVDTRLNEGKVAALKTYAGFFSAVLIYAALALLADDFLSRHGQIKSIAYVVASVLLVFWGILIISRSNKTKKSSSLNFNFKSSLAKGFAAGISSPVTPFLYLAFLQILNSYTNKLSLGEKAISIVVFEVCSFLTTWIVGSMLIHKKKSVKKNWRIVKIFMGIFLIGLGTYNLTQQIKFDNGIQLEQAASGKKKNKVKSFFPYAPANWGQRTKVKFELQQKEHQSDSFIFAP